MLLVGCFFMWLPLQVTVPQNFEYGLFLSNNVQLSKNVIEWTRARVPHYMVTSCRAVLFVATHWSCSDGLILAPLLDNEHSSSIYSVNYTKR